jgi:hypothetical protein
VTTNDERAEQLYQAVLLTLEHSGFMGLLAAGNDAKAKLPYKEASAKTKHLFVELAANLTEVERKATLEP